jgi:hypothetical protein
MLVGGRGTMVEYSTHQVEQSPLHPNVKGLSPAIVVGTGKDKLAKRSFLC